MKSTNDNLNNILMKQRDLEKIFLKQNNMCSINRVREWESFIRK
jgi:hypothetical protein